MSNAKNMQDIDVEISALHDMLDKGFYPEEYHKFTREMEAHFSKIEELTTAQWREVIDLKNANTELEKTIADVGVLTLYPEDFHKTHDWSAVCQQLSISTDATSVDIGVYSVNAEEESEEDE